MLSERKFKVTLNEEYSKNKYVQNGFSQEFVLTLAFFNIYIADNIEKKIPESLCTLMA